MALFCNYVFIALTLKGTNRYNDNRTSDNVRAHYIRKVSLVKTVKKMAHRANKRLVKGY